MAQTGSTDGGRTVSSPTGTTAPGGQPNKTYPGTGLKTPFTDAIVSDKKAK
jgi:hypothetical protein